MGAGWGADGAQQHRADLMALRRAGGGGQHRPAPRLGGRPGAVPPRHHPQRQDRCACEACCSALAPLFRDRLEVATDRIVSRQRQVAMHILMVDCSRGHALLYKHLPVAHMLMRIPSRSRAARRAVLLVAVHGAGRAGGAGRRRCGAGSRRGDAGRRRADAQLHRPGRHQPGTRCQPAPRPLELFAVGFKRSFKIRKTARARCHPPLGAHSSDVQIEAQGRKRAGHSGSKSCLSPLKPQQQSRAAF